MLSVNFPESEISSFTLESFFYACRTLMGIPVACTVTVSGYVYNAEDGDTSPKCSTLLGYDPGSLVGPAQMD
jgi:hypothetical protein